MSDISETETAAELSAQLAEAEAEIERLRADTERLEAEVKRLSGTLHGAHVLSMDAALKDNRRQAKEIERLRAALRDIAEDDIYLRNCATWHDTGKMKTGVQAFARAALENK